MADDSKINVGDHFPGRKCGGMIPRSLEWNLEGDVKKSIIVAIGAFVLLVGCGKPEPGIPVGPKWKGVPYRASFDTKAAKPSPNGISIPPFKYSANPDALVTRALLVLKVIPSEAPDKEPDGHVLVGNAVDIKGSDGALPADYTDRAGKALAQYFDMHCMKGKFDVSVALAQSSLIPTATVAEADNKRLSDWLPLEVTYKNPHSKCK
ncbi:MAG: hypothetical protein ABR976_13850 [Terracidiphilus sp.]